MRRFFKNIWTQLLYFPFWQVFKSKSILASYEFSSKVLRFYIWLVIWTQRYRDHISHILYMNTEIPRSHITYTLYEHRDTEITYHIYSIWTQRYRDHISHILYMNQWRHIWPIFFIKLKVQFVLYTTKEEDYRTSVGYKYKSLLKIKVRNTSHLGWSWT